MINAVIGSINSEVVLSFDVLAEGPKGGDSSNVDPKKRACIIKGSKAIEKGVFTPFSEGENPLNTEYFVEYKDMTNTIMVSLLPCKVNPKIKIYCKLPTPERYEVSELFLEGNFDIVKVNIENSKKTLNGSDLSDKLYKNKIISIDSKLFFEVVGPPLIKQDVIQSSIGEIKVTRPSLNVEI